MNHPCHLGNDHLKLGAIEEKAGCLYSCYASKKPRSYFLSLFHLGNSKYHLSLFQELREKQKCA